MACSGVSSVQMESWNIGGNRRPHGVTEKNRMFGFCCVCSSTFDINFAIKINKTYEKIKNSNSLTDRWCFQNTTVKSGSCAKSWVTDQAPKLLIFFYQVEELHKHSFYKIDFRCGRKHTGKIHRT